jgi:hypothetical protein
MVTLAAAPNPLAAGDGPTVNSSPSTTTEKPCPQVSNACRAWSLPKFGLSGKLTAATISNHSAAATSAVPGKRWSATNTTQSTQVIVLPDSSKVSLKPESNLKFSFSGTAREVHLKGEAFFEVKHNPDVPFFVHANEVTTKVLGTSFIIKAIEREQRVTVVVKTGKVSVYTSGEQEQASSAEAIILTPNQQIVFDTKVKEITKTLVENPQIVIPREQVRLMRFEEAPVTAIFKALEKAYGVKIEFDEAIFSSCELTTVISEDGIYNRLDIICDAIGTTYKLLEDRIAISGTGCNTERDD